MHRKFKISVSFLTVLVLSFLPSLSATAVPWDGNDIIFENGQWEINSNLLGIADVTVINPANSLTPTYEEYTDIWDRAGFLNISFDDWATRQGVYADAYADMDVTDDVLTGDKVITTPASNTENLWAGILGINHELRIYSAGDLVRSAFFITNSTNAPVSASFALFTNFGSDGELFSYQGQSDSILAVPALENSTSATALNTAGAQWIVHNEEEDAPGAFAYGSPGAEHPGVINISGDDYDARFDDISIPAGATIVLVAFLNWTPELLIADSYSNEPSQTSQQQAAYATAATVAASEFNSFSGRLVTGLSGYNILNWKALPDPGPSPTPTPTPTPTTAPAASLAKTGAEVDWLALGSLIAVVAGAGLFAMGRGRRTE